MRYLWRTDHNFCGVRIDIDQVQVYIPVDRDIPLFPSIMPPVINQYSYNQCVAEKDVISSEEMFEIIKENITR
jgi:hypothetical protein